MDFNDHRRLANQFENLGAKDFLKDFQVNSALMNAQKILANLQQPGVQEMVKNLQGKSVQESLKNIAGLQNGLPVGVASKIAYSVLPPKGYGPTFSVPETAIQAAARSLGSRSAGRFMNESATASRTWSMGLSPTALATARYAALKGGSRSGLSDVWRQNPNATQFAALTEGVFERAAGLLADPNVRRMAETIEPEQLLEESVETVAGEEGTNLDTRVFEEEPDHILDLEGNAVDRCLAFVGWAIVVLSVACIMAMSNPQFAEYRESLSRVVMELVIVERVLIKYKDHYGNQ